MGVSGNRVAGLLAAVGVLLCAAPSADACSVTVTNRTAQLFDVFSASTDVFIGTVLRGRGFASPESTDLINARFRVLERFKGAKTAEVDADFTSCSGPFDVGETYLVFGTTIAGRFHTRPLFAARVSRPTNGSEKEWAEQAMQHVRERVASPTLGFLKITVAGASVVRPAVTVHVERLPDGRREDLMFDRIGGAFYRILSPGRYRVHVRQGSTALTFPAEVLMADGESRSISMGAAWASRAVMPPEQ